MSCPPIVLLSCCPIVLLSYSREKSVNRKSHLIRPGAARLDRFRRQQIAVQRTIPFVAPRRVARSTHALSYAAQMLEIILLPHQHPGDEPLSLADEAYLKVTQLLAAWTICSTVRSPNFGRNRSQNIRVPRKMVSLFLYAASFRHPPCGRMICSFAGWAGSVELLAGCCIVCGSFFLLMFSAGFPPTPKMISKNAG